MLNIQRILFPTDLSEGSMKAFSQAAYLAHRHDAELHVLNVTGRHRHDYSEAKENFPIPIETLEEWLGPSSGTEKGRPNLQAMPLIQKQVESATPPERILTYVEDEDIDLVVMSTHGRRGVDRMLFGSVTEEVVRKAPCPVFTVRADADVSADRAVRRILVPIDFSDASESAVVHAKEIALTYGAEIDLLHVVEETVYPSAYGLELEAFPTQDVLHRVEKQLGDMAREDIGYEHVMVEATVGHAPLTILDYIEDHEIDLVVIATHGRTGFDRMLLGSVAERVLRRSPKPVFVVKPNHKSLVGSHEAEAVSAQE